MLNKLLSSFLKQSESVHTDKWRERERERAKRKEKYFIYNNVIATSGSLCVRVINLFINELHFKTKQKYTYYWMVKTDILPLCCAKATEVPSQTALFAPIVWALLDLNKKLEKVGKIEREELK